MPIPRVAVLMSVFNEQAFLAEAVRSVLDQSFVDLELVIVNDGSTDRSREIAASFREEVPVRWARLWVDANVPSASMNVADLRELAGVLDQCAERFFTLHPDAHRDAAIARHRASMLARVLDKLGSDDWTTSLAIFAKMFGLHAATALRFLPRLAAILFLGRSVLRFVRRRLNR